MPFQQKPLVSILSLAILCAACGGSSSGTPGGSAASATSNYPYGLAVSSPTATDSSGLLLTEEKAAFDSSRSFEDKKADLDAVAAATTSASCKIVLPNFSAVVTDPACYGPALDYVGHLDWTGGLGEDGQLPSGDLGLWSATEANGTACAAAKMNKEIEKVAAQVDSALLLAGSVTCLIRTSEGMDFPAESASLDVTAELNTAIQANNALVTITGATIARQADISGFPDFLYTIVFTVGANTTTINFRHHPTNSGNTNYKGKIWAKFVGGMPGGSDSRAFSLLYEKSSSDLKYKMTAANYNSGANPTYFTGSGDIDIDAAPGWNGNISQTIMSLSSSTGLGSASYAWQAGTSDSHARVFNMYTSVDGARTVAFGFFGYGEKFDNATGTASDNEISNFICNWAGPQNNHNLNAGKAQKQFMELDNTGKFVPDTLEAGPNLISYAPVNSCDMTIGQQNGSANDFKYKLVPDAYLGVQPAVTNELVTLASDTEYQAYTAPVAPTDF